MVDSAVIRLTEQSRSEDGSFVVVVEYEEGSRYEVTVSDPASESDEALFGWYFEEHLRFPFLDGDRRVAAVERLREYGETLFGQVFGGEAGRPFREIWRRGFDGCRIEVTGAAGLHRLHWEALCDPEMGGAPLAVRVPVVRRVAGRSQTFELPGPRPTLNILVVTARPDGSRDVGFRTISRPLLDAMRQATSPVTVDLVRPGTWAALRDHLRTTSEDLRKGSGWYHLVHFDLHGAFTDQDTIDAGVHKGRYLFATDRERAEGRQGFLFFETAEEGKADPRSAGEVASLLAEHRVPMAVLNACQSAMQTTSEAALAHQLVEAGVPLVLGMAYSVTVTAAELAMPELYQRLTQGADADRALLGARRKLFDEPERDAYFDQQVPLQDWLLPVVFQQRPVTLRLREMSDEETDLFLTKESEVGDEPNTKGGYGFVGRDLDIQAIERLLLVKDRPNQLLVRAMAGAGKSTLLAHLAWWWRRTGLINQIFPFSDEERAWTVDQVVRGIAAKLWQGVEFARWEALGETAKRERVARVLRATRHVLILDNTESITASPAAIPHALTETERTALTGWLTRLRGGKTLVLWGSREPETWAAADTFGNNVYNLSGLDPQAASTLTDRILTHHHATHHLHNPHEQDALTKLLGILGGYPLPLEVVLPRLATTPPSEVAAELNSGGTGADPVGLIRTAIEYSHGKLDPALQHSLLMLAPFIATIPGGPLLDYYQELLNNYQPTDDPWGTIDITAGLAAAKEIGLATSHPALAEWMQVMPVLPYFLRQRLHKHPTWLAAAQHAHYQLHTHIGELLQQMMVSHEPEQRWTGQVATQASYPNLTNALHYALQHRHPVWPLVDALDIYLDQTRQHIARQNLLETTITALERRLDQDSQRDLMHLYHLVGMVAQEQRQFDKAKQHYRKALDLKLKFNKGHSAASTYHQLGIVAQQQQQYGEADRLYGKALDLYLEFGDRLSAAGIYHQLGTVAQEQRQFDKAKQHYRKALELRAVFNDQHRAASTHHQLGTVAQEQRQFDKAKQHYRKALELKLEFNDRHGAASTYHQLGIVAQQQRLYGEAEQLYRKALELKLEFNDRHGAASTYGQLGIVASEQRRFDEAEQLGRQALNLQLEFNDQHGAAITYHQLGIVASEQQQFTEAEQLYRQASTMYRDESDPRGLSQIGALLGRLLAAQGRRIEAFDILTDAAASWYRFVGAFVSRA
jgi:tetratricopeptide (TPR) repeat protein